MVRELLDEFYQKNKTYPRRLVFLRDGVSDGQFKQVRFKHFKTLIKLVVYFKIRNHEINEIRAACLMINTGYRPGITFIIVKKRHHTRLFPNASKDMVRRI
jgi:eukaryotic translation initiation factor 2C